MRRTEPVASCQVVAVAARPPHYPAAVTTEQSMSHDGGNADPVPVPVLTTPDRHPNAPAPGAAIPTHYPKCFGCGHDVPAGLRMTLTAAEDLRVTGQFEVTEDHQGAPGLAHGGIVAAAFDEAMGGLNWLLAIPAVTGKLEITFRKPIQIGQALFFDCEIVGVERRKVFNRGVARIGSLDGPIVAEASAIYVQVPLEHFVKHGRPDQVRRFAEKRGATPGGTTAGGTQGTADERNG